MVNVQHALRNSIHSLISPRIVPKTVRKDLDPPSKTPPASDPAADFRALFTANSKPPTPSVPEPAKPANPTAEAVFGPNAFVKDPGGVAPNGATYGYNPMYFATRATADKLAQMYGGTVVETNAITPYGPFAQNQPNEMIKFGNGNVVNAGVLASYYNGNMSQDQIDRAIAAEIAG